MQVFILLAMLCPLSAPMMAQSVVVGDPMAERIHRMVEGKVMTLQGKPVQGAQVELYSNPPRLLSTDRAGEFQTEFEFLNPLNYTSDYTVILRVTKKGFQDGHRLIALGRTSKDEGITVTLRPPQEDPTLLPRADLIRGLGPGLRQLGPTDGLSAKEAKDYARGVQEFLDRNRPEQAVPNLDKVAKLDPSCLRCRTMLALVELSWGDFDDAYHELAESVNAIIKDSKVGCPEPLVAYGTLMSWEHQGSKSGAYFAEALKYAPRDPLALQELGRSQSLDLDWEFANETLEKALAAGAGPEARLMHAEALLWAGTVQEARDELDRYLDGRDIKKMPPPVRTLSDRIEEKKKDAAAYVAANAKLKARGEEPLDYLNHPPKNLADFEPATDQSMLDTILSSVGQNIAELYKNLPNTSSIEKIHQEMLSQKGKVGATQDQKFRYLCLMPTMPWGPSVDEYRADSTGIVAAPRGLEKNFMLTSGFVAAPLMFHPTYQAGSSYRYLGREKMKGSSTYVIAFAQQPARTRISGSFRIGDTEKLTYLQGLAWIDASSYQIVRLLSDLLTPVPQVKLDKQTTDIEFSEVQFNSIDQKFWLPNQVTVTLGWSGQTFRNKHHYSDFLLFNVQQAQKIGMPKKVSQSPSPDDRP